eukprot:2868858-Rhodomonas_salina.1
MLGITAALRNKGRLTRSTCLRDAMRRGTDTAFPAYALALHSAVLTLRIARQSLSEPATSLSGRAAHADHSTSASGRGGVRGLCADAHPPRSAPPHPARAPAVA